MEKRATNRTHLIAVNGDTVQQFTITMRRPAAKPLRMYYWQGDNRIMRTQSAYNGKLLDGPYQLTNRREQLLGSGGFSKGLKTGLWRTWRPDGTLLTSRDWYRGRPRGNTVEYNENGRPVAKPRKAPAATRWWQPWSWFYRAKKVVQPPMPPTTPTSSAVVPQAATVPAPPVVAPPVVAPPKRHRWQLWGKKAVRPAPSVIVPTTTP